MFNDAAGLDTPDAGRLGFVLLVIVVVIMRRSASILPCGPVLISAGGGR